MFPKVWIWYLFICRMLGIRFNGVLLWRLFGMCVGSIRGKVWEEELGVGRTGRKRIVGLWRLQLQRYMRINKIMMSKGIQELNRTITNKIRNKNKLDINNNMNYIQNNNISVQWHSQPPLSIATVSTKNQNQNRNSDAANLQKPTTLIFVLTVIKIYVKNNLSQ